jgi:hypothetical protein
VGFYDGQKWRWGRFSPRTSVFPANLRSICFSTIIFTIIRGWHNRPGVAAVPIASQTRIKKKKIATNFLNSYDFQDILTKEIQVFQVYTSEIMTSYSACCLLHDCFLLDFVSTLKMEVTYSSET